VRWGRELEARCGNRRDAVGDPGAVSSAPTSEVEDRGDEFPLLDVGGPRQAARCASQVSWRPGAQASHHGAHRAGQIAGSWHRTGPVTRSWHRPGPVAQRARAPPPPRQGRCLLRPWCPSPFPRRMPRSLATSRCHASVAARPAARTTSIGIGSSPGSHADRVLPAHAGRWSGPCPATLFHRHAGRAAIQWPASRPKG